MSGTISTERLFSLPCFEGLRLLRKYMADHPDLTTPDLLSLIDRVEADAHSLDMEASVYLSEIVEKDCPLNGHAFYQTCIRGVLLKHQPIWAKLMRQGRQRFVKKLDPNDQDIFAAAGLMESPTPIHVVKWWDSVSGYARVLTDQEKMEQGRAAEVLTLEYERERLKALGIDLEPEWPGFDDNFAGYDVLSYDHGPHGIQNKLIEVKSTTASPLRFILTRNEWEKAEQAGDSYRFHVWDMTQDPPHLVERTVADVVPHIPADSGKGRWTNTQVPVLNH
ncbi:uncharacterized protein DUF3883 [Rhodovulum imhoffii]|uniref:Uncharacterized protein DUF3883 n=1 Tax=Rhodovulum imhoffii TaxID=365340 RepID=A0A2T5BQ78_9RHOB|nr:DUF3883 domain-containing protein [Rhodovulum imhoffii]MBK5932419.1 hypothetical protein [Rhodovulum imhoffii]PTN01274.1 uncharacterized protein DUF3883 [Rhodovulum imhoffii]